MAFFSSMRNVHSCAQSVQYVHSAGYHVSIQIIINNQLVNLMLPPPRTIHRRPVESLKVEREERSKATQQIYPPPASDLFLCPGYFSHQIID